MSEESSRKRARAQDFSREDIEEFERRFELPETVSLSENSISLAKYWCQTLRTQPVTSLRQLARDLNIPNVAKLTKKQLCSNIALQLNTNINSIGIDPT